MEKVQEKISVIIPVHNGEAALERAVNSALDQRDVSTEIILIDDGSTDHTSQIIDQIGSAHNNVLALSMGNDCGVSAARNRGLQAATGDFVTFLDADDAMEAGMLSSLRALYHETGSDICGCQFCSVHEGQEQQKELNDLPLVSTWRGEEIVSDCILKRHDTRIWSKLFTHRVLEGKKFKEGLTIGEDVLFFLSLINEGTSYSAIETPLYRYTVSNYGTMEKAFVPSHMDQLRCWEEVRKMISQHFPAFLGKNSNEAMLSAIQVTSAVLTASKICRVPENRLSDHQKKEYASYLDQCRSSAAKYAQTAGVRAYLPKGYAQKEFLLEHLPGIYRKLYQGR